MMPDEDLLGLGSEMGGFDARSSFDRSPNPILTPEAYATEVVAKLHALRAGVEAVTVARIAEIAQSVGLTPAQMDAFLAQSGAGAELQKVSQEMGAVIAALEAELKTNAGQ